MNTAKGWRRISNKGGFVNETTGETLIVTKKEFGLHYHVLLFTGQRTNDADAKNISPDFPTEVKAESCAMKWMEKNPNGSI
ncbi:MAG TPA: hypothetical protein VMD05_00635 [Candidatus Nanoarchaeia archaeon]|nr:hypothetical protein [Candidatus Nanoarchaeia archaeon]